MTLSCPSGFIPNSGGYGQGHRGSDREKGAETEGGQGGERERASESGQRERAGGVSQKNLLGSNNTA